MHKVSAVTNQIMCFFYPWDLTRVYFNLLLLYKVIRKLSTKQGDTSPGTTPTLSSSPFVNKINILPEVPLNSSLLVVCVEGSWLYMFYAPKDDGLLQ
jgi:hypothetical protein